MRREDFADEAAWLAWQQTQLDWRRPEPPKPAAGKKRVYSHTWTAKASYSRRKGSRRIATAYRVLAHQDYRARKLAQDEVGYRQHLRDMANAWASRNPKRVREIAKRTRVRYREKYRWEKQRYYIAHREEILAREHAYRASYRDEINAQKRVHYSAHKEEILAREHAYRAEHREEINARDRKRRAAKKAEHRRTGGAR